MSPGQDPPIRRRKGTRHDRTGCLTCRLRRKKCVQNILPKCGSCTRLNLECVRRPPTRLPALQDIGDGPQNVHEIITTVPVIPVFETSRWLESTHQDIAVYPPTIPPPAAGLSNTPDGCQTPSRRIFMRYYVEVLAWKLTACGYHNSFLWAFLPMAMESPTLLDAIIAFASGNLSNFDQTYRLPALEARSRALTALGNAVAKPLKNIYEHETALASCLILSTSEAVLGQRTGWSEHLVGAQIIIQSARIHAHGGPEIRGLEAFRGSPEGECLLRNFAYHDILGSVTLRKPALISGAYLESISGVVDSYMGVHSQVLVFISQISSLDLASAILSPASQAQLALSSAGCESESGRERVKEGNDVESLCSKIENGLKAWSPSGSDFTLAAMGYAYRSAALVYLYRRIRQYISDNDNEPEKQQSLNCLQAMIQSEVAMILSSIGNVPLDGHPNGVLLFPLFIAGGEATHYDDIDTIRKRLHLINESRGFRNVLRACEVLEEVWTGRSSSPGFQSADWQDVLQRQGG